MRRKTCAACIGYEVERGPWAGIENRLGQG
jgi:hypothetical protein